MITRDDAQKHGLDVMSDAARLKEERHQKIAALKKLFPGVVTAEGTVNADALRESLQDALGKENISTDKRGYGLNFVGKALARSLAETPTDQELAVVTSQSRSAKTTGNVVIRGDNLDALKILQKNYTGKVKCIYIDPPYNTQSDAFIYKDNFFQTQKDLIDNVLEGDEDTLNFYENIYGTQSHSGWLAFMTPRLLLANKLLTEDGVIFISIDDNEQANLKLLCDEIFGEENFVANIIWIKKTGAKGMVTKRMIVTNHEYILVYAKTELFKFIGLDRDESEFSNPDNDPRGPWKRQYIQRHEVKGPIKKIKDPSTGKIYSFLSPYTQDNLNLWLKEGRLIFPKNAKGYIAIKEFLSEYANKKQLTSVLPGSYPTKTATEKLNELMQEKVFDNPKPIELISVLIKTTTEKNDFILDFFAGSGTTGEAVMRLNREDGGQRKYILVQSDESISEDHTAHAFCKANNLKSVISSIMLERLRRAGDRLHAEQDGALAQRKLDTGYKVYVLTDKPRIDLDEEKQLHLTHQRTSMADTLINMIAASGKPLTASVICLEEGCLYQVGSHYYVLAPCKKELKNIKDGMIYIDAYASIPLTQWLNLIGIEKDNVKIVY